MFSISSKGSFKNTESFLHAVQKLPIEQIIAPYAQMGVDALNAATPKDSGLAAGSWGYVISNKGGKVTISWTNVDVENGFPVAVMLQYGYGTGTGGYVAGRDYINPAMKPIFDQISEAVWKAVKSA